VKEIPDEKWISKKRVKREFPPMEPDIPKEIFNLVNVAKCQKEGYYVEMGVRTAPKNPPLEIEYTEEYIPYYAEYFATIGKKYTHTHTKSIHQSFSLIMTTLFSLLYLYSFFVLNFASFDEEHFNFVAEIDENEPFGPVIVSMESKKRARSDKVKCIVHTKKVLVKFICGYFLQLHSHYILFVLFLLVVSFLFDDLTFF
jgi:hypothetical protein